VILHLDIPTSIEVACSLVCPRGRSDEPELSDIFGTFPSNAVHLLTFTIVPLIASGIFYGVDSRDNSYVNCLTLCTSAMTVTGTLSRFDWYICALSDFDIVADLHPPGLNPVLMENTSRFQQAIVFFLQIIGNIVCC
jgi:hypothetical protein